MSSSAVRRDTWKSTRIGRIARFIGSVRCAVPALALSVAAMIWGTYIESTQSRAAAAAQVYGSWWFILLMGVICACLILSVAVRYPWKPKHTGFIIVHASLISLIAIGFFTMFTKIEGRVILEEGDRASTAITEERWVELLEPGQFSGFATAARDILDGDGVVELNGASINVLGRWENSVEQTSVTDGGTEPFHALQIAAGDGAWEASTAEWLGQLGPQEPPYPGDAVGFSLRIVPVGEVWTPPESGPRAVLLDGSGTEYPLDAADETLGDSGWSLTNVALFQRATIGGAGLVDREDGPVNWAAQVLLTHEDGSVERQIVFEKFRGDPFVRQQAGARASSFRLAYVGPSFTEPTLAIMRSDEGEMSAVYAEPGGDVQTFEHDGQWPWQFAVAGTPVSVLQSYGNAQASTVRVEAPSADSVTPVLLVESDTGPAQLVWNTPALVVVDDQELLLRYGPERVVLPFALELVDFRKMDYPGSDMAMAYESDVIVTDLTEEGAQPFDFRIYMNNPYVQDGWKVYQASFIGDSVTVLQVTRDPGLVPMYIACTTLCLGIVLIFYSRKFSHGHPGIPAPFGAPKKPTDWRALPAQPDPRAPSPATSDPVRSDS